MHIERLHAVWAPSNKMGRHLHLVSVYDAIICDFQECHSLQVQIIFRDNLHIENSMLRPGEHKVIVVAEPGTVQYGLSSSRAAM